VADNREALKPNYDAVLKGAPSISIQPEHVITDSEIKKELDKVRLGPASHDPVYSLTEKRLDVGQVKIH
jgi:hypothetical protein